MIYTNHIASNWCIELYHALLLKNNVLQLKKLVVLSQRKRAKKLCLIHILQRLGEDVAEHGQG